MKYHQAAIVPPGRTCTYSKFWNIMILFLQIVEDLVTLNYFYLTLSENI